MASRRWTTVGKWRADDAFALQALQPLEGAYLPWSGFALRPSAVMTVINEMMFYEASSVVELGSGLSTVYAARFMRQCGPAGARIVSVDDNEEWLGRVHQYLERDGLTSFVELVYAPLIEWRPSDDEAGAEEGGAWAHPIPERWYDRDPIRRAVGDREVDFLLVDGPRAKRTIARYPALLELHDHLSADATVVLDDAARPGEVEIVDRWTERYGLKFVTDRTGLAVGRRA